MSITTTTPATTPAKPTTTTTTTTSSSSKPFQFWFHFTVLASLITLLFITLTHFYPQDLHTWFLTLPPSLRSHYSRGATLRVQVGAKQPQVEVFLVQEGPTNSPDKVLFVHGIGCSSFAFGKVLSFLGEEGVHGVAVDLPGSGFSEKSVSVVEEGVGFGYGVWGWVWEVYEEIKEKGIFSGFDELVEKGYVDQERRVRVSKRSRVKGVELGSEEMGRVLLQVIGGMGLAPVNLVLHDSAFVLSANWVSRNLGLFRSVVILDGAPGGPALPVWAIQMPGVREVVLGSRFVFERVVCACCIKSCRGADAEAHRILLKGREGRRAVAGMGKKLNSSFDINEWAGLDGVKGLPMQIIWSAGWLQDWSEQGHQLAKALPHAAFVTHSGGRWPQEHNAIEIAESVYRFVSSLPKSSWQAEEEAVPDHKQRILDGARNSGHAHPGYAEAYGLGLGQD